ncbi:MAG: (Fe-S)-binding protein [Methanosarcinaceae archaeon]|nr:(Fe-S)-binding protein [Methanosarcinaceae archaeon]
MDIVAEHRKMCTKCGMCMEVCPRYDDPDLIDNLYGYLENMSRISHKTLDLCLTCGLCAVACPQEAGGIKKLISASRKKRVKEHGINEKQTILDPEADNNIFKAIMDLRQVPEYKGGNAPVVYFPGCAGSYINTSMAQATVAILEEAGIDYTVLSGLEYCCGAASAGSGNMGPLMRNGPKNIEEISNRGAKTLITACPGCFRAFKDMYPKIFGTLDFEVLQISQYLDRLINQNNLVPKETLRHRVFYHDPCHMTRGMGVYREARNVIDNIPGTQLANKTPQNSACCGFGGGVRISYPDESLKIASDVFRAAKELDCDMIITNCAGCMQNLCEAKAEESIEVVDLAEYVALSIGVSVAREDRELTGLLNKVYSSCIPDYQEPGLLDK